MSNVFIASYLIFNMSKTVLYVIDSGKFFDGVTRVLKKQSKKANVIYVTTNKPYDNLINSLEEKKIDTDNIFFIDCISKEVGVDPEDVGNCIYLDSPKSLTSMSIAIKESIENIDGEKTLILDSLSTLLIYNDARTMGKFSNFLINKMRSMKADAVILTLESDVDKDIIKKIESFVDKVEKI